MNLEIQNLLSRLDPGGSTKNDFDFLLGNWNIKNMRLKERLSNSNKWIEFPADITVWTILNGYGNVDRFQTDFNGTYFEASSLRLFDKDSKLWTFYWMDTNCINPIEQVIGAFQDDKGVFYGRAEFEGKLMDLKFVWEVESESSARWHQAYYDKKREQWEVNWIMEFSR